MDQDELDEQLKHLDEVNKIIGNLKDSNLSENDRELAMQKGYLKF